MKDQIDSLVQSFTSDLVKLFQSAIVGALGEKPKRKYTKRAATEEKKPKRKYTRRAKPTEAAPTLSADPVAE